MGKKVLVPEFTENCRGLLEGLFKISEVGLLKALGDFVSNKYSNVEITEDYVYAEGNIPVMLIAHVDTVFRQPIRQFTYNERRAVYKGKEGLVNANALNIVVYLIYKNEGKNYVTVDGIAYSNALDAQLVIDKL